MEEIISHGIDDETGKNIVLPPVHPFAIGAKINLELNEWVLSDD